MEKLTYKQAYDKIIQAYFKDEIKPLDSRFCFCGTLCNNSVSWNYGRENNPVFKLYSSGEYLKMENALFMMYDTTNEKMEGTKKYEDSLFAGMSAALSVLQDIHRSRGENVDDIPEFTKRHLTVIV